MNYFFSYFELRILSYAIFICIFTKLFLVFMRNGNDFLIYYFFLIYIFEAGRYGNFIF